MFASARVSTPASLSFAKTKLKLRDEDLKNQEFQLGEVHPSPTPAQKPIWEEDLNIKWTDEEDTKGMTTERSDDDSVGHMFGS